MKRVMMTAACTVLLVAQGVLAEKLTNASVIQLVNSGAVTEDVIVSTVSTAAEVEFDTSVNGIIALSTAKVPPKVIEAMQKRANPAAEQAAAQPAPAPQTVAAAVQGAVATALGVSDVYVIDGGNKVKMQFSAARREVSGRAAWSYGRSVFNLVVPGTKAALRINTASPEFIVPLSANQNVDGLITLVSFGVRKHRYVACNGGQGATGLKGVVHDNRLVGISVEKVADQSNAPAGCVLYSVKPTAPLVSANRKSKDEFGEYGLNIGNDSQFFDFGVDE